MFLDEIARKLTLDSLCNYALTKEQRNRQFIIITPHSLKDVRTNNEVRIVNMGNPITNSAHGLQQQTIN